jgi:hypothetical protein
MRRVLVTIALLLLATALFAQDIPPGIALPIRLTSKLDVGKTKTGEVIKGELPQEVRLPGGGRISRNSRVSGHLLGAGVRSDGSSFLRISFNLVRTKHHDIPVTTSLRAIASMPEVQTAQTPERSPAFGESPYNWTTVQVGGGTLYITAAGL